MDFDEQDANISFELDVEDLSNRTMSEGWQDLVGSDVAKVRSTERFGPNLREQRIHYRVANRGRVPLFRLFIAMGKIRGTPRMRSHIVLRRGTTKFFG